MPVQPWAASDVVSLGQPGGIVTLIEGSTFCISGRGGDILMGSPQGYFAADHRFLSQMEMKINGKSLEPLTVAHHDPLSAMFVARARPRTVDEESTVLVTRSRRIGTTLEEDILVRCFGKELTHCWIEFAIDTDFADLFEVKAGNVSQIGDYVRRFEGAQLLLETTHGDWRRDTTIRFSETPQIQQAGCAFEVFLHPGEEWCLKVEVIPSVGSFDADEISPEISEARAGHRFGTWRRSVPVIETNYEPLATALRKSYEDLGALRMFDPARPTRPVVAAGAPWFMALFGRDSIITAWMALIVDPDLALGTLESLARYQGSEVNDRTEEQPGRILHELRLGGVAAQTLGGAVPYYGSIDSTPLFVMLLGEIRRWGLGNDVVERLLPHADRAMEWIEKYGDLDGDGYVEYHRKSESGLENQGWKEARGAICFRDGSPSEGPIALCEVQGYVYAAYIARMHFAMEAGDAEEAQRYADKAEALKVAFNRDFWVEDTQYFALALDGNKKPVDGIGSNVGHCLWTGIIDEDKAAPVVARLMGDTMFTGWGLRTLASDQPNYNPLSYHTGSVWPHDSAIAAAGMMRYGFVEESQRLILALIDTAMFDDGRLPELFSGIGRDEISAPVAYPTSCSPQAWAAGAPLLGLRTLLRLDPLVPNGAVSIAPALPPQIRRLRIERVPLYGQRLIINIRRGEVEFEGISPELTILSEPRSPSAAPIPAS